MNIWNRLDFFIRQFFLVPYLQRIFIKLQLREAGVVINNMSLRPDGVRQLAHLTARHFSSRTWPNADTRWNNPMRKCSVGFPAQRALHWEAGLPVVSRPGRESSYECSDCGVGLCVDPCFRWYHLYKHPILVYKRLQAQEEYFLYYIYHIICIYILISYLVYSAFSIKGIFV